MGQVKKIYRVNNSQCRKCLYRCADAGISSAYCGYLYYTGERRPCEPSPNCTAFVKFRKKERYKIESKLHSIANYWVGGMKDG